MTQRHVLPMCNIRVLCRRWNKITILYYVNYAKLSKSINRDWKCRVKLPRWPWKLETTMFPQLHTKYHLLWHDKLSKRFKFNEPWWVMPKWKALSITGVQKQGNYFLDFFYLIYKPSSLILFHCKKHFVMNVWYQN